MGSVGSTNVGLGCSKFLTLMLSFANTAISKIAAHFDQTSGGSAHTLSQKGLILSEFFV